MISEKKIQFLKSLAKDLPHLPGAYLMKNKAQKIIYVGKAKDLKKRVSSYFTGLKNKPTKVLYLNQHIASIDFIVTKTEVEAFLTEASLIKKHKPRYNVRLKDDKRYPYIQCQKNHDFPRFYLVRKVKNDGNAYFGPYTSGFIVREVIEFLNDYYKIRDCTDSYFKSRKRPCMTHQIGKCPAPCVQLVSKEIYNKSIQSSLEFLSGKNENLIQELHHKMTRAAEQERFEAAARFRDHIRSLEKIWERQLVVSSQETQDQDCFAFFGDDRGVLIEVLHVRKGRLIGNRSHFIPKLDIHSAQETEKDWFVSFLNQYYLDNKVPDEILLPVDLGGDLIKLLTDVLESRSGFPPQLIHSLNSGKKGIMELASRNARAHFEKQVSDFDQRIKGLTEIQKRFKLKDLPVRIECYDISNFQGMQSVASQVVFENGEPKKEDYRLYKIRTVDGANDYASLEEAIKRRLNHKEYERPQLILIDGGKGQLSAALKAVEDLGEDLSLVGMAKSRSQGSFMDQEVSASEERFFLPGRKNPVTFLPSSQALKILVQLRNEAHRFAIENHRRMRDKNSFHSFLDPITGVGPKTKKKILKKVSTVDELIKLKVKGLVDLGVSKSLAAKIIDELTPSDD